MKNTIIVLSLLSAYLCASEGNEKNNINVIYPEYKPVLDTMKRECENGLLCRMGLSAYRSSVMFAADIAKAPTIYEFFLQEPHPRNIQRSHQHGNQENK